MIAQAHLAELIELADRGGRSPCRPIGEVIWRLLLRWWVVLMIETRRNA